MRHFASDAERATGCTAPPKPAESSSGSVGTTRPHSHPLPLALQHLTEVEYAEALEAGLVPGYLIGEEEPPPAP